MRARELLASNGGTLRVEVLTHLARNVPRREQTIFRHNFSWR